MPHPYPHEKKQAKKWAYELIHGDEPYVILDTETTGLYDAEIVDICILHRWGTVLLDTLVKPTESIPEGATRIHKITDEMVEKAPTFPEIYPKLKELIEGKIVVIYNSGFDTAVLRHCCKIHGLPEIKFTPECAMLNYAQYCGEWSDYFHSYKWQKLPGGGKHRALADCQAVYYLLKKMAEFDYSDLQPKYENKLFPPIQLTCEWQKRIIIRILYSKKGCGIYESKLDLNIWLPIFKLITAEDIKLSWDKTIEAETEENNIPF